MPEKNATTLQMTPAEIETAFEMMRKDATSDETKSWDEMNTTEREIIRAAFARMYGDGDVYVVVTHDNEFIREELEGPLSVVFLGINGEPRVMIEPDYSGPTPPDDPTYRARLEKNLMPFVLPSAGTRFFLA